MKRLPGLAVNFAWAPPQPARTVGYALCALAALLAATVAGLYLRERDMLERWQSDWTRLNRLDRDKPVTAPEQRQKLQEELRYANRVIDKLDMPWDTVFDSVERSMTSQATLLSVEPDGERRELRLVAEAKDVQAMLDYLRALRESPVLAHAHLVGHQINMQDPQRPIRFTVMTQWAQVPVAAPTTPGAVQ